MVKLREGMLGARTRMGSVECITTRPGEQGAIFYGPYEMRSSGFYSVDFELALAATPETTGDPVCVIVDVVANQGTSRLAEQRLLLSDLKLEMQRFTLTFQVHELRELEYRIRSSGPAAITAQGDARVTRLGDLPGLPSAMGSSERAWENEREFLDGYLRNISGVVHVGANLGQERRYYWLLGLDVIWIEPIRETYEKLVDNLAGYSRQRPLNLLLADQDGKQFEFQIANEGAGSSSILPLQDHARLFPHIQYVETRTLTSCTLATVMREQGISTETYQGLTLDVEGAELLVLQGAGERLKEFRYVKCEVADFPTRTGSPTVDDLDAFLTAAGFEQIMRRAFADGPDGHGTYWDIVWKRVTPGEPVHQPGHRSPQVTDPHDVEGLEKCE